MKTYKELVYILLQEFFEEQDGTLEGLCEKYKLTNKQLTALEKIEAKIYK